MIKAPTLRVSGLPEFRVRFFCCSGPGVLKLGGSRFCLGWVVSRLPTRVTRDSATAANLGFFRLDGRQSSETSS